MRKYTAEFIGTFFLVFTIVTTVRGGAPLAPLAIGLVLAAMVFAGGHVSGAHFNPAVTLAVWIRGKVDTRDVPGYVVAQLLGASAAAGVALAVIDAAAGTPLKLTGSKLLAALLAEAVVTFALAYVVLNVATSADTADNSFYGLAIGATVLAGAIAVGGVSGGVFNPAVAVGASFGGLLSWSTIWVYLVANMAGAAGAAVVFGVLNPADWSDRSEPAEADSTDEPARVVALEVRKSG